MVYRAYNTNQYPERTIELFNEMREKDKIKPNNISYILYFQACIQLKLFDQGKAIHEELKQKTSAYMKNKVRLKFLQLKKNISIYRRQ